MRQKKIKFYLMTAGGLTLVFTLMFLLFFPLSNKKSEGNPAPESPDSRIQYRNELQKAIYETISQANSSSEEKQTFSEGVTTFFSLINKAESNMAGANGVGAAPAASEEDNSLKTQHEIATASQPSTSVSSGGITILDKPVKDIFPLQYLVYIQSIVDFFKEEKLIPQERQIIIQKTSDVFGFLDESLDYFLKAGVITKTEYPDFHYGLTIIWPRTLEMEFGNKASANLLKLKENGGLSDNLFAGLWRLLHQDVGVKKASAQGLCFRSGANASPAGVNLWAPCCNCYCGNVPCGCLNSVCKSGAAIYDDTTGICGCG